MKSFLRLITELNLWVAFAVVSLCYCSFVDLAAEISYPYLILVFSATVSTYNFQRLIRKKTLVTEVYPSRAKWYRYFNQWNLILILFTIPFIAYFGIQFSPDILFLLFFSGFISLLYPVPVYRLKDEWKRLRDFPLIKIFLVAIVWTIVTLIAPMQLNEIEWDRDAFYLIIERFIFIVAITIPFDIRDLKYDKQLTIPKIFGEQGARILSCTLYLFFILFFSLNHFSQFQLFHYLIIIGVLFFLGGMLLIRANSEREPLYFNFWIESIPVVQALCYFFFLDL